jgi:hypothetical protein
MQLFLAIVSEVEREEWTVDQDDWPHDCPRATSSAQDSSSRPNSLRHRVACSIAVVTRARFRPHILLATRGREVVGNGDRETGLLNVAQELRVMSPARPTISTVY